MSDSYYREVFSDNTLSTIFPPERANQFFEALFGDASEGAYDIRLTYKEYAPERQELVFELELHERPGQCLACNLTHGLPEVFIRHPIVNIKGLVQEIGKRLDNAFQINGWQLRHTRQHTKSLHAIPLVLSVQPLSEGHA